ncbi:molybdenum cofactor biosynthesis prote [Lentinus tigrinus ALCF2SS1-7]|uniref:molybdenum cofactor biosynthesis prote n=1 Tax=Lentinus tigrinus ALCF2SS1-7 TaxID=1328758 RepID=UPI001165E8C7|nr:molybdenum cofactor biosynthesis prote [Lentinus tigrinus ALCF2SS1-7]
MSSSSDILQYPQDRITSIEAERGVSPFLIDTYNRQHNYLRISLTERCNLRCFYCMPSEGIELSPPEHLLSDDEIIRLATLFVQSGVTKIRLTGGEPTVRKGIVEIVGRLNELRQYGLQSIGMTTNGIALHRKLPALIENGLTHLNISLDTLDPFKFEIMTRRMGHDAVLRSLHTALASPELQSVKLNAVVVKGLNDHEAVDFVEMTKESRLSVRFIEFMPFTGNKWDKAKMVPSSELLARIQTRYPELRKGSDELNDTARSYIIPGHLGSFGFISSMSDHFCGSCNRLRLTADGQIKVCLFDAKEISLRDQMRSGASDDALLSTVGLAVKGKKEKHAGMEDIDVVTNRPMILIGGVHRPAPARSLQRSPRFRSLPMLPAVPVPPKAVRCFRTSSDSDTASPAPRLTHIDDSGRASMVDVGRKEPTRRTATASGRIVIPKIAYQLVTGGRVEDDTHRPSSIPRGHQSPTDAEAASFRKAQEKARSKGDVLTVAQLAGIMGCKRTAELIPLCHPLQLSHIAVTLHPEIDCTRTVSDAPREAVADFAEDTRSDIGLGQSSEGLIYSIVCRATVSCEGKTGVEMEALTAVSVGLLTVWDMLKAVAGKEMIIQDILVEQKAGGRNGSFVRSPP